MQTFLAFGYDVFSRDNLAQPICTAESPEMAQTIATALSHLSSAQDAIREVSAALHGTSRTLHPSN